MGWILDARGEIVACADPVTVTLMMIGTDFHDWLVAQGVKWGRRPAPPALRLVQG